MAGAQHDRMQTRCAAAASPAKDGETLLKSIKGVTHLVFNPYEPANRELGRNIAELGGKPRPWRCKQGAIIKIK